MYMAYTSNPHLPEVRRKTVLLVRSGWSIRKASRYVGVEPSTVMRWVRKAPTNGRLPVPTQSSRPHSHPKTLNSGIVSRILQLRAERNQCAELLLHRLHTEGIQISLSSIKRTLKRHDLVYPSPWKKWHRYQPRPVPAKPGILVEIDSMWDGIRAEGLCAYAFIDICSRWAYVEPVKKINAGVGLRFVKTAKEQAPFKTLMIQSDHGSEFAKWFTTQINAKGIEHRLTRIRKPTDNGHVERFIRTLQQECLNRIHRSYKFWEIEIPKFIHYYNHERPHMGLNMKTPIEVLRSY